MIVLRFFFSADLILIARPQKHLLAPLHGRMDEWMTVVPLHPPSLFHCLLGLSEESWVIGRKHEIGPFPCPHSYLSMWPWVPSPTKVVRAEGRSLASWGFDKHRHPNLGYYLDFIYLFKVRLINTQRHGSLINPNVSKNPRWFCRVSSNVIVGYFSNCTSCNLPTDRSGHTLQYIVALIVNRKQTDSRCRLVI